MKKGAMILVLILSFWISESTAESQNKKYFRYDGSSFSKWSETDFEVLNKKYAKGRNRAFRKRRKILKDRSRNLKALNANYSKGQKFVYFKGQKVKEADKDSFKVLDWPNYGKDVKHVYYRGKKLAGIDSKSFKILDFNYAKDNNHVYYANEKLIGINPKNFKIPTRKSKTSDSKYPPPLPTPEKVKGIYLTGYTFSRGQRRAQLIRLIENTELNTMVIDIKDPNGDFMFPPAAKELKTIPLSRYSFQYEDLKKILSQLQENNIYTIARITTFQDHKAASTFPHLALKNKWGGGWKNWKGLSWLDMTNPLAWDIPLLQAKEAALLGFDEIQFDYIRFPSDGNLSQIHYYNLPANKTKYEALTDFYKYASTELEELKTPVSVDLFGFTYNRFNMHRDLNIGQRLIDAGTYFDYISPMVYPSHYPKGYNGFDNPEDHPYSILNKALKDGKYILKHINNSKAKTRPWIQAFNLGLTYDGHMLRAQIKACEDNNSSGWLLWNSRNSYPVSSFRKVKFAKK